MEAQMSKSPRNVRFEAIHNLYNMNVAALIDEATAKKQLEFAGHFIYQSELQKFVEKYPDIDASAFAVFADNCGIITAKKRSGGGGGGKGARSLATAERAEQNGVAQEEVAKYVALVNSVYDHIDELNKLITTVHVSFSFPKNKVKEEKPVEAADAPTDQAPVEEVTKDEVTF